jgi:hypothetical protein
MRDRLLQPRPALHLGEPEGRTLGGEQAQDRDRALDRLDALALLFRITGRCSDCETLTRARGAVKVQRRRSRELLPSSAPRAGQRLVVNSQAKPSRAASSRTP